MQVYRRSGNFRVRKFSLFKRTHENYFTFRTSHVHAWTVYDGVRMSFAAFVATTSTARTLALYRLYGPRFFPLLPVVFCTSWFA